MKMSYVTKPARSYGLPESKSDETWRIYVDLQRQQTADGAGGEGLLSRETEKKRHAENTRSNLADQQWRMMRFGNPASREGVLRVGLVAKTFRKETKIICTTNTKIMKRWKEHKRTLMTMTRNNARNPATKKRSQRKLKRRTCKCELTRRCEWIRTCE